jgi:hypothetical protein
VARAQPLWDVRALRFYPPEAAKLDPHPTFFWICSLQRTLNPMNLDLFILKGLRSDFLEVRILKELGDLRALSRVNPLGSVSDL